MRQFFAKSVGIAIVAGMLAGACVSSRIKPITQAGNATASSDTALTVFLLERDIPKEIEKLGVIVIRIDSRAELTLDEQVKQRLRRDCQQLGANGAYRINDGTYYPNIVNYLVFRYKK